ncbi:MAG: 5-oxoprolinase subunit PxpB [Deltaproteobacteria bacterium]
MTPTLHLTSERTLLIRFSGGMSLSNQQRVESLMRILLRWDSNLIRNLHPAYASLLVEFDPSQMSMKNFVEKIQDVLNVTQMEPRGSFRELNVPVLYHGEDLEALSIELSLSPTQIIQLHCSTSYTVFFLGFQPGFPYLGELPLALRVPRLSTPRTRVSAGSVAIAGMQTGIYPRDSAGGWRILGKTPIALFTPDENPPTTFQMGDRVKFFPIDEVEFNSFQGGK